MLLAIPSAIAERPNFVYLFVDDLRCDTFGYVGNPQAKTPNIDALASRGIVFDNAFVTLSICSPSRATALTGRYAASVGVSIFGRQRIRDGVPLMPEMFRPYGYTTAIVGKWHVGNSPAECGFDWHDTVAGNGRWYNRQGRIGDDPVVIKPYIEQWISDRSIAFLRDVKASKQPFVLWHCTQVPHMDHRFDWPAREDSLVKFDASELPLPTTWNDNLIGKPPFFRTARSYVKAQKEYGYEQESKLRRHIQRYYAAVHEVDQQIGRVIREITRLGLAENTYIIFMSDNGWLLGEHGMTSKVVAYEKSIRVPLIIVGPSIGADRRDQMVANIDILPTMLHLAGIDQPGGMHGESLHDVMEDPTAQIRERLYYESPSPQLVPRPQFAVRDGRYKYIETRETKNPDAVEFVELYDLDNDAEEATNLATAADQAARIESMADQLRSLQKRFSQ
ncbi:MAG: sulfatase-like hydrolase/transferase [Pirellulaceae bacterium]|nr:sulfatase-like hydrolase/transferase [Pirellulaceae bacterium]